MKLRQRFNWLMCLMLGTGLPATAQMNPDQLREAIKDLSKARFTLPEVDDRRAQLQRQLNEAAASASLTPADTADIQARLKSIAGTEAQLKQKKQSLTFTQALNITRDLNRIAVRLRDCGKFKANSLDDIASLRKNLSDQINSAVSGVVLTHSDAAKLSNELKEIATKETSLRQSANVTPKQILGLANAIQRVNAHFAQNLKLIQSALADLNKREADLQYLIDNAAHSESISQKDATAMRHHLDNISATQTRIIDTNSEGPLTSAQVFLLAGQIDALQSQLEKMTVSSSPPPSGLTPFTQREPEPSEQKPETSAQQ